MAMVWLEGLAKIKRLPDLIGTQTHDLPTCIIIKVRWFFHLHNVNVAYMEKPPHLDFTQATGCKHPRLRL
jgi:hypothetical protein